jgi:WD40 repeat protein
MALFFQHRAALSSNAEPVCLGWCNSDTILAVGTSQCTVELFLEEGEPVRDVAIPRCRTRPVAISWHPHSPVLVFGCENGEITLWNHSSRQLGTGTHRTSHRSSITLVVWSPDGSRLVTGDEAGVVSLWSFNGRSSLKILKTYKKSKADPGALRHAVFTVSSNEQKQPAASPPLFIGGECGNILFADDMGTYTPGWARRCKPC